jgi:hypothetical protein
MNTITDELKTLDLGDARLNRRAMNVLSRFAENPQASIPAACHGWNETDAAYKFFANAKVDEAKILRAHAEATLARCAQEPTVLVVQDTTELDYSHKNLVIDGLGVLNDHGRSGMFLHPSVAFTPEGCCLGVVSAEFFTRSEESLGKTRERANWPIEDKESFRWLQGYRRACAIQRKLVVPRVISIADCEADIYDIFVEAQGVSSRHRWPKAHYIIRAKIDRCLPEKDEEAGAWCYRKLWATMEAAPERFRRTIELPATPKRAARTATLVVRAQSVTLKPPYRKGRKLVPVTVNAVLVQEIDPPQDAEPVEWLLITSLPIESREDIEKVIDYYQGRWPIEPYFRTLKTGCRVEELQLESIGRLKPCVALYLIVAWRVQYVTMLGREYPELPADVLFTDAEWQSVWSVVRNLEPLPPSTPSLKEFLPILASLGGYLGRSQDPPPGPKAMWIAIRRMTDYAHAWLTFGPGRASIPP